MFFGMEKMLAREITNLGYEIIKTEDGRITYKTDEFGIAKSNMWLRCAERVHLKIAEFEAKALMNYLKIQKRINWSRYIPYGAQFPISKSFLYKIKIIQYTRCTSHSKKGYSRKLKEKLFGGWFA